MPQLRIFFGAATTQGGPVTASVIEVASAVDAETAALITAAARVEAASAADTPTASNVTGAAQIEAASALDTPDASRAYATAQIETAAAVDSPVASLISSAAVVEATQASDQQSTGVMPKDASIVEAANAIDTADAVLAGAPPTPSPSRQQTVQIYEDPGSYARLMEENKRRALELWAELFRGVLHLSEEDARLRAEAQLDFEQQQIEEEELVLLL